MMGYFAALVLSFQLAFIINVTSVDIQSPGGPVGQVIMNKVQTCPVKSSIKSKLIAKFNRAAGDKSFNADITIPFNMDNNIRFQATLYTWKKNEWVSMQKLDGSVCQFIENNLKAIWNKLTKSASPKMGACNTIKKGSYAIKNALVDNKDNTVNYIMYGKFKVETVIMKGKEPAFCIIAEGESLPPKL